MVGAEMRIFQRHLDVFMPEQFLHGAQRFDVLTGVIGKLAPSLGFLQHGLEC